VNSSYVVGGPDGLMAYAQLGVSLGLDYILYSCPAEMVGSFRSFETLMDGKSGEGNFSFVPSALALTLLSLDVG